MQTGGTSNPGATTFARAFYYPDRRGSAPPIEGVCYRQRASLTGTPTGTQPGERPASGAAVDALRGGRSVMHGRRGFNVWRVPDVVIGVAAAITVTAPSAEASVSPTSAHGVAHSLSTVTQGDTAALV